MLILRKTDLGCKTPWPLLAAGQSKQEREREEEGEPPNSNWCAGTERAKTQDPVCCNGLIPVPGQGTGHVLRHV